jgi:hypothetical protein
MSHVGEVVFALERFEWSADDRLEVVGRWDGLQGRRMGRPALTVVESGGRRRRLNALPGGQLAGEQPWRASFAWDGDGETVERAELELGRRLVVELPPPRRARRRPGQTAALPTPAVAALETELEQARDELARLRDELAQTTGERDELAASARDENDTAAREHDELTRVRDALALSARERDELAAAASAASQATGERDALQARLERALAAREAAERKLAEERSAAERLRSELAERAAAPPPAARLPPSRPGRARPHGAHRVRAHRPTVMELWGARLAAVVLAGLLLLALALVLGVVL